jgi:hypothetical protein
MTIEETVALKGGIYADSGATVTGTQATNYRYLVVNEDAVFTALTDLADTPNNVLTEWGLTGKTLKSGMVIAPASGLAFKTVTVASGSVLLIKG